MVAVDDCDHDETTMKGHRPQDPSSRRRRLRPRIHPNLTRILAVVVLLLFGAIQLVFSSRRRQRASLRHGAPREQWIQSRSQPFNQDGLAAKTRHLVVVAGHSVTISGHLEDADQDERDWYLLDYQRHRGLPSAIVKHIQAGLQAAAEDQQALLVFSGGETRATTGPETEASSYYRVADAMDLWPTSSTVRARTITEEFATDSFENLMFSICRFREVTGAYPDHITVVSFTFKQHRFETMHAEALQWPAERFSYIGVDPPASTGFDLAEATKGELENAAKPFQTDPYGCHSAILQDKRKQRNPFSRTPPYPLSCPEMKDLLGYCGPEIIAKDKVPWQ